MKRIIALILVLTALMIAVPAAHAAQMSDARSMLSMVNKFRTGDDAWYWNSDNSTITKMTNLGILQYDPELEEVAKIRAKELSVLFEHTRPDGTDCFSAFPDNRGYMGENIACGYPTAADAFEGFLETDEDYDGQGHRRIMLMREFTRLGVAVVEVNGYPYWVMEFADAPDTGKTATKAGWEQIGSNKYYRKSDGSLVTGWLKQKGNLYLMDENGVMLTGWQEDGGKWYYLKKNGVMMTGWLKKDGKQYYLTSSGARKTGWLKEDGKIFYFDKDGVMQTGWLKKGKSWYYMLPTGEMVTGWKKLKNDGKSAWYYFLTSGKSIGVMVAGWQQIDGKTYHFDSDGRLETGWKKLKNNGKTAWSYFLTSGDNIGVMVTGLQQIDGETYYFDGKGRMKTGWKKLKIDGKTARSYFMPGDDGRLVTGWQQIDGNWYHFDSDGRMQTGWLKDNGNLYYFRASGEMVTGTVEIDDVNEVFADDGVWLSSQINDYDTPLSTESFITRLIKAIIQTIMKLPVFE